MTTIDSTYILDLLANAHVTEYKRAEFYRTQPYPAMTAIAADRAFTLTLLIEAVQGGLLEELAAKNAWLEKEAPADFAIGHVVNIADINHPRWGTRAIVTGAEPVSGDVIVEYGDGGTHAFAAGQLMHHSADDAHVDPDDGITNADVMSADELYESDRDDEFRQDAADDERNAAQQAADYGNEV